MPYQHFLRCTMGILKVTITTSTFPVEQAQGPPIRSIWYHKSTGAVYWCHKRTGTVYHTVICSDSKCSQSKSSQNDHTQAAVSESNGWLRGWLESWRTPTPIPGGTLSHFTRFFSHYTRCLCSSPSQVCPVISVWCWGLNLECHTYTWQALTHRVTHPRTLFSLHFFTFFFNFKWKYIP